MATNEFKLALEEAGNRIVKQMVDSLYEQKAVITGKLARSIESTVVESQNGLKLEISMEDYGFFVDQGSERGPGKPPPVQPIIEWIKRRGISPPAGFPNVESFAYAIAKSIGNKGQRFKEPKPFIQPSVEFVANSFLPEVLERAGVQFIEQELDKIAA